MKIFLTLLFISLLFACTTVSSNISIEYFNIGNAYFEVENFNKAIEYYIKALEEDDSAINRIRFNLAVAYSRSGRVEEGLEYFELLLEEDRDNLKILQSVAYSHYLLGNIEESLFFYNLILSIFEYDSAALYNKALILLESDNEDEARELLEKLYVVDNSVEVVLQLGNIYQKNGKWDDYITLYEKAVIENGKSLDILSGLIQYYEAEKSYYKVLEYIDVMLNIENVENRAELLFKKGSIVLLEMNDFNKGFEDIKKSVESGFEDMVEIRKLVETENLPQSDQLLAYFRSRELYSASQNTP